MALRTLVIVNPKSCNGRTGRRWPRIEARLREAFGPLEVEATRGPRDAERLAREAVRAGVERLLVAGGDGTASEVVTGLLGAGLGEYASLGLLPLGTGGDFARTLGLPRRLASALERIASGEQRRVDAGRVRYRARDGSEREAYFLNVASFGVSGRIAELVNRGAKRLGPRLGYYAGTVRGVLAWSSPSIELQLDGRRVHAGPLVLAAAANARYFGGGMKIAPHARPDDGLLDVVTVPAMSRAALLWRLPRVYRGTHLQVAGVQLQRARTIEATAEEEVWIEADGEPIGRLPVRVEVLPGAVRLLGAGDPSGTD